MEKLYSIKETAELLQVSTESARRYVRAGKIRASKIGRSYRITESDIKAFLDSTVKEQGPKQ